MRDTHRRVRQQSAADPQKFIFALTNSPSIKTRRGKPVQFAPDEGVSTMGGGMGVTLLVTTCPASGGCAGMLAGLNGSSSSECTRLPAGSTIVAVTKIIRFFFT